MPYMWLALSSMAFATPGLNGALHIGASPVDEVAWVGIGGGAAWTPTDAEGIGVLEVGAAFATKGAVHAMAGVDGRGRILPASLSGRWLVLDEDDVRLAVTLQGGLVQWLEPEEEESFRMAISPGIALDAGGTVVRFDLAVPVWGVTMYGTAFGFAQFPFPLGATVGIDFLVNERQRIRFGVPELFSWHLEIDKVYLDIGGVTVGVAGVLWGKIGARF